jgi:hypothetical protein
MMMGWREATEPVLKWGCKDVVTPVRAMVENLLKFVSIHYC